MLKIAFSPIYKYDLEPGHRFPMEKYELLPRQLLHEGTISEENFFHPEKLSDEEILMTHTSDYLAKLNNNSLSRKEIRSIGFPVRPELIERGKFISMGTYQACLYAQEYGVAMNIAGGTHHSFRDRGEGFCLLNDFAIASHLLLDRAQAEQILIIDLDVHQGNGTASIMKDNPSVFTFSIHGKKNYPLRKEASDLDIGLEDHTGDEEYLNTLGESLDHLFDTVKPDMVMYLSGVDVLATDKLGRLGLTKEGCKERDRMVLNKCRKVGIPISIAMGGGYNEQLRDLIDAHANTFRLAQDIYF